MAIKNFVPAIWSGKIFTRLRKSLIFQALCNTDYEGEIRDYGDVVKINEIGPITINDYTKDSDITWETLDDAAKELKIDQQKYFAFSVDDVDKAQAKGNLVDAASGEAAYSLGDTVDQFIAGKYADAGIVDSTNLGATGTSNALVVTAGNVIERISYVAQLLDEKNVPRGDRWFAIPPWIHRVMVLKEIGGISATAVPMTNTDDTLRRGLVGQALGFNFFMSNNVSNNATEWRCMAGTRMAISLAFQIIKTKAVEREDRFDDGIKGLAVYGGKVVRPNALATAYYKKS